jgi:Zn-dependent protease with chaperone function
MNDRFRFYVRAAFVGLGVLVGPDLLFGAVAGSSKLIREGRLDQLALLFPIILAMIACALWGILLGPRYVRSWFMAVALVWNLWCMLDVLNRAKDRWEYTFALPWLIWTLVISFWLVRWRERIKTLPEPDDAE